MAWTFGGHFVKTSLVHSATFFPVDHVRYASLLLCDGRCLPLCRIESFSPDANEVDKLSSIPENNAPATRFLRAEVKVTMELAGLLHDSAQSKMLLQRWLNNGESVESVAAKLRVHHLPQQAAVEHANWNALVKYVKMSAREKRFAKFGTGYQTKAKTLEWLTRWAMTGKSDDYVAGKLGMSKLPKGQYKNHENYKAFKLFQEYRGSAENMRAKMANI